ncbi:hypothetical protein [Actinomadura sp. DC4]|uniref:hypothetical protein n=1 Tax=Actinomadura sp. DC4 TaxID=3055069 RepID=UPI0025AF33E3|nr:hypothetical protein [Actinomadura sp. DC4]MDN3357331.1 hypothetical protein [Actinomadura sp. DC4]
MEMEMASTGGYGEAMPKIQEYLEKYRTALEGVRATHRGRPISEVRRALAQALDVEGVEVWNEVAEDAARLISEEKDDGC